MKIVFAVLVFALPALAHDAPQRRAPNPQEMAAKMTKHLREKLDLTETQTAKIGDILKQAMPERAELEKKLRALDQETHEKIRAELTNDQRQTFDMMRAHGRMMMRGEPGMMRGRHGAGRGMMGPRGQNQPETRPDGGDNDGVEAEGDDSGRPAGRAPDASPQQAEPPQGDGAAE